VEGCDVYENIEVHHIKRLHRKVEKDEKTSILDKYGRRVKGSAAVLSSINRKQVPLCPKHHLEMEKNRNFANLDYNKLARVMNRNNEKLPLPKSKDLDFKPIFEGQPFKYESRKKEKE
jgi:hypothetical protein